MVWRWRQVLFEVGAFVARGRDPGTQGINRSLIAGLFCGVLVMYLTGLAIKVWVIKSPFSKRLRNIKPSNP